MKYEVKCPCCDEILLVSMQKGEVIVSQKESSSDIEVSEILKEFNIEFG